MKITRKNVVILTFSLLIIGTSLFASFPVKSTIKNLDKIELKPIAPENFVKQIPVKKLETYKKTTILTNNETSTKGDDELLITLALWFFLGLFAAHRWYKGKPAGWNILFILTAGGCGVWTIVDLINILTGKF